MNPDINWQTSEIRWRPIEANEDCAILPVNTPEQGSEEWVEIRGNKTLHPSIEEVEDEEEWKNSFSNLTTSTKSSFDTSEQMNH